MAQLGCSPCSRLLGNESFVDLKFAAFQRMPNIMEREKVGAFSREGLWLVTVPCCTTLCVA